MATFIPASFKRTGILLFFLIAHFFAHAQSIPNTCPTIVKRNNGNGQASSCASIGVPVAANVVGTIYATILADNAIAPSSKTGDINFKWLGTYTNLPVITRVWIGTTPSTSTVVGPPPVPTHSNGFTYAAYCFYGLNLPSQGFLTLEFSDPQTGAPFGNCTYNLGNNEPATPPGSLCAPVIQTQPSNVTKCGNTPAIFTVTASGAGMYQWQYYNGSSWTAVSGADFSGTSTSSLTVNNPVTYYGRQFRVVVSNATCSTSTTSNVVVLKANALPTATFNGSAYLCGTGARNIQVNFTGTAPWSLTYTTTPSGGAATPSTINNITTNPYYLSINPSVTTSYQITGISDFNCSNTSLSGNVNLEVQALPTANVSNASTCVGSGSFNLSYSNLTLGVNRYSISAGTRAMAGFSVISNATMTSSPISVMIPTSGVPAGVYDFNLLLTNTTSGCTSAVIPFTLTVNSNPVLSASTSANAVCAGSNVTLTAAPSNLNSYSWTSNPSSTISSVFNPTVTPAVNTTYTVTGTNANGCSGTANVSISMLPAPALNITPSSVSICNGEAKVLSASGGNTYSWTASGFSATGASVVVSPTSTTNYTVTSQTGDGCAAVGNVTVTVNTPSININNSSPTVCAGGSSTLTASGGSSYTWTPATGLSCTSCANPSATPAATTTYYVTGTSNGCITTTSTTVTVSAAPINTATSTGTQITFCEQNDASLILNVATTATASGQSWSYATSEAGPYTPYTTGTTTITGFSNATINNTGSLGQTTLTFTNGANAYTGPQYFRYSFTANSCNYNYTIKLNGLKASVTPAITANKTTVCNGETATLTIGSITNGAAVQWESSPNNSTWTAISGATLVNYTTPALSSNTYYRANMGGHNNCNRQSASILISVASAPSSNTVAPSAGCTDGSATYTLTGSIIGGATYQWQSSVTSAVAGFTDIIGATGQNYSIPGNLVGTIKWFRRVVQEGTCYASTSTASQVNPPITSNQIATADTAYCGTAAARTLSASSPSGGNGIYAYQWQSSTNGSIFSNISGATNQSYTTSAQSQTYWYRRNITSGGCTSNSASVRIRVNTNPTINSSATSNAICNGTSTSLSASGAARYSWSPSTGLNGTTGGTVIAGPTSNTTYTVTGTDTNGCNNTSQQIITVNALPTAPTLSAASVTICNPPSSSYTLSSSVSSTAPGGESYVWYTVNETNPSSAYLINPATISQSGNYYLFSKNNTTGCFSSSAQLAATFVNISTPVPLVTSFTACSPATANLNTIEPVAPSGITYEWHTVSSNPNGGTLVTTPAAAGSGTYYLYGKTSNNCYSNASTSVVVIINSKPSVSVSSTSLTACSPNKIDLNANISSPNSNYNYNWYTVNSNPGISTQVSNPNELSSTGTYYLYAVDNNGCLSNASSGVSATINNSPSVEITAPSLVCSGAATSVVVSATNATGYQWQALASQGASWTNVSGGVYSGESTNTLSISSTTGLSGYLYKCIVSGAGSCVTESPAIALAVEDNAAITTASGNITICSGLDTIMTVAANVPAGEFQWKVSTNGGSSFTNVADGAFYFGSQLPELSILNSSVSQNSYLFYCEVSNYCASDTSVHATLTVHQTPTAPVASNVSYCLNAAATQLTANGGVGNTLLWYTVSTGGTGSTTAPTPSTSSPGTMEYYVSDLSTDGCESSRDTLTVEVKNEYVWIGNINNNWNVAGNWECNSVPPSFANVRIIANPSNQPQIQNNVFVNNINFGSNSYVELNSYKFSMNGTTSGTPTFKSNNTSSLEFTGAASTSIYFTGGTNDRHIKDLTVNNSSASITLGSDTMIVHGTVAPTAGTLNFNGKNVRIKSTATYTARVAEITGLLTNAGNVTVERFVPAKPGRRWSSMASPVQQLIANSWQQDIYITGPGTGGVPCSTYTAAFQPQQYTNGFDATQTNASSFFEYNNTASPAWQSVTGTNNTNLMPGKGYYVNVRGDRNVQGCDLLQYTNPVTGTTPTYDVTVKATGTLTQGDFNVNINTQGYHFLGNPYACELNFNAFHTLNAGKIQQKYWLYDPANIGGNYMTWDGTNFAGASVGYNNHNIIASGQGFFVEALNSVTPTTLGFKENQKLSTYQKGAFKTTGVLDKIRINIYKNGDTIKQDDALVIFDRDTNLNNTLMDWDSKSINSGAVYVATMKGGVKASIQKRYQYFTDDTVDVFVYAVDAGNYNFSFTDHSQFANTNIYLLDNQTNSFQNLNQNPVYSFNLSTIGANANRFKLIFQATTPLASNDIRLDARILDQKAQLTWSVTADENRTAYSVQSSGDANTFKELERITVNEQSGKLVYNFSDQHLVAGSRYYRVKSILKDGSASYSNVAMVSEGGKEQLTFVVHPNPVKDEMIISITGTVHPDKIRVLSITGNLIMEQNTSNPNEVKLNVSNLARGVYFVELSTIEGIKTIQKILK